LGNTVGPASATSGRVAVYNGTTGKLLQDGTKLETDLVVGPASSTDNAIARFDGTTGKLVQNSDCTISDTGAVTLTASSGQHVFSSTTYPPVSFRRSGGFGAFDLWGDTVGTSDKIIVDNAGGIFRIRNNDATITGFQTNQSGAVTFGPSGFAGTHTVNGLLQVTNNLGPGFVLHRATTAASAGIHFNFRNDATGGTSGTELVGYAGSAATSGMDFKFGGTTMGSYTAAGVWTLGPSSGATAGHVIQSSVAASTSVIYCRKHTGGDTTSNYYLTFTTDTTIQGYIWNNAAGNIELLNASDVNLKENIRDADYGLNEVLALRPVKFDWKTGAAQNVKGFIAQEVQPILPESVTHMPDGNLGMGMHEFIPVIVSAIKEQNALIVALQARIDGLKARIEALESGN
jgi:hypothetical protein